jgi:TM2 domain-containing membrane protein YozV
MGVYNDSIRRTNWLNFRWHIPVVLRSINMSKEVPSCATFLQWWVVLAHFTGLHQICMPESMQEIIQIIYSLQIIYKFSFLGSDKQGWWWPEKLAEASHLCNKKFYCSWRNYLDIFIKTFDAVVCNNDNTEHIETLYRKNSDLSDVRPAVTYSNHWANQMNLIVKLIEKFDKNGIQLFWKRIKALTNFDTAMILGMILRGSVSRRMMKNGHWLNDWYLTPGDFCVLHYVQWEHKGQIGNYSATSVFATMCRATVELRLPTIQYFLSRNYAWSDSRVQIIEYQVLSLESS